MVIVWSRSGLIVSVVLSVMTAVAAPAAPDEPYDMAAEARACADLAGGFGKPGKGQKVTHPDPIVARMMHSCLVRHYGSADAAESRAAARGLSSLYRGGWDVRPDADLAARLQAYADGAEAKPVVTFP